MQLGSKENPDERFNHYLEKTYKKTASLIACCCKAVSLFVIIFCTHYSFNSDKANYPVHLVMVTNTTYNCHSLKEKVTPKSFLFCRCLCSK